MVKGGKKNSWIWILVIIVLAVAAVLAYQTRVDLSPPIIPSPNPSCSASVCTGAVSCTYLPTNTCTLNEKRNGCVEQNCEFLPHRLTCASTVKCPAQSVLPYGAECPAAPPDCALQSAPIGEMGLCYYSGVLADLVCFCSGSSTFTHTREGACCTTTKTCTVTPILTES